MRYGVIFGSIVLTLHGLMHQAIAQNPLGYGSLSPEEYDRPADEIDADIQEMVSRMTLEEKIGQMTQINQDLVLGADGVLNRTAVEYYAQNYYVGSYLNQLARDGKNFDHQEYAKTIEEIQEITLSVNSTYKIPIIYGLDHIHGAHYVAKSTIFPHGVNLGASFNPKLAYETAVVTARETRAANVQWTFAPVLDIPMSKQWARVYENFGEDPYMSSILGAAAVRGYQGKYKSDRTKVAASMKHFIAYGAPYSGQDRDTTIVSDRIIHDYFVPGFQAAIDAGVATAMESYIDVNGEPVVSSHKYLQEMLREQLKFKGMLVTDWAEIANLYTTHKVAASHRDAVRLSIGSTSVDMSMVPSDVIFFEELKALVLEGTISEARVDESVLRLLQLKKDLGLLEPEGWKADPALLQQIGLPQDIELAREAARESITLLKNENNVLPLLSNHKKVLVVGPTGNNLSHLAGGWTIYWQGATVDGWKGEISDEQFYSNGTTIFNGLRAVAPEGTTVDYVSGFDINGKDIDMEHLLTVAPQYDVIVVCIGEHVYAEAPGDIHDIRLPQGQIESIKALKSAGKPIVSVLVEGRPRVLDSIPDDSDALVQAYLPGPWGGQAIGEILFGKANPSGRLPYTYPKSVGDINLSYWRQANDVWDPLYEFGHGLSYTRFTYDNITLSNDQDNILVPGQTRTVSIQVNNEGPWDGLETVLMFVQQPVRRVTPPAKLLKGFEKIQLAAGESKSVDFEISADMFRYTGLDGVPQGTIDPGPVKVMIGNKQFDFEIRI
ncbi:glycoside hydrolase superfamily [Fennellomyces sp. T-0311]|nr:glycoside hydrolase superfamily [Fennellomyces sp. T-0311]